MRFSLYEVTFFDLTFWAKAIKGPQGTEMSQAQHRDTGDRGNRLSVTRRGGGALYGGTCSIWEIN